MTAVLSPRHVSHNLQLPPVPSNQAFQHEAIPDSKSERFGIYVQAQSCVGDRRTYKNGHLFPLEKAHYIRGVICIAVLNHRYCVLVLHR